MEKTINQRILKNLELGPKKYSELLKLEQDSVVGYKKYLKRKIKEHLEGILDRNEFDREEDKLEIDETNRSKQLIKFAYEEFIKEMPDNGSMIEFRSKLNGKVGHQKQDFGPRAIHISYSWYLRKLLKEEKIIRIQRGLYKLTD